VLQQYACARSLLSSFLTACMWSKSSVVSYCWRTHTHVIKVYCCLFCWLTHVHLIKIYCCLLLSVYAACMCLQSSVVFYYRYTQHACDQNLLCLFSWRMQHESGCYLLLSAIVVRLCRPP
jgi:hypothetical protein